MSEEFGVSTNPISQSWNEIWIKAITQPSETSYDEIVNDPNASTRRAYSWIFVSSLIGFIFYVIVANLLGTNAMGSVDEALGSMFMVIICGAPIGALVAVLGAMINAGFSQLIASALGGTGTYSKLVYAFAAYLAPLALVSYLLGAIPFINCLALPLGLYGIFLNVTAVKAVNKFGWGKAIVSSVVIWLLLLVLLSIAVIVILALLGPAIGNVFSNIMEGIGTPVP